MVFRNLLLLTLTFTNANAERHVHMGMTMTHQGLQETPSIFSRTNTSATVLYGIHGTTDYSGAGGFISELDAVITASNIFNPLSIEEDREYMGAIIKINHQYFYTAEKGPVGQNKLTIRLLFPRGTEIIAFWHTHGDAGWDRHYFSDDDYDLVKKMNLPLYLADYTSQLKILLPEHGKPASITKFRNGLPVHIHLIKGSLVADSNGKLIRVKT